MGAGSQRYESDKDGKLLDRKYQDKESHDRKSHGRKSCERKSCERKSRDRKLEVTLVPDPPDGGYGWVVVFASMMLLLLCHR